MSKRRINKQQSSRIAKQHQHYRHSHENNADKTLCEGLVIKRYSRHAHIEDAEGQAIHCAIRPNLDSLVAGDRVIWQLEGPGQGIVLSVYPRQTVLGRPDAHGHVKAIAANISQMMIVIAPAPPISWLLLDSYLVMAEYLNIQPFIILNKTDLDTGGDNRQFLLQHYEPLGYPLLFTHIKSQELNTLQKSLRNQISVFVGQSGVGKSSLIRYLLPHEASRIQTGEISAQSQLGCHTTSNSHLYHLPSGGDLIDSPGVREFSLWSMPQATIAAGFREFKPYVAHCKFRNCSHFNTPNCAVIQAVKTHQISLKRYENYVKMINNTNLG
ncbi:MAG: ribosome small subunit-dependent GTPase A [Legionella sp.]|nr:MAG: ribosome small subunit-dependent GTPase A [Legionella sp.]